MQIKRCGGCGVMSSDKGPCYSCNFEYMQFANDMEQGNDKVLPTDAKERKDYPIATGVLDYFPDAISAIAQVSKIGNEQHNPGSALHWDRSKSGDEADACMRHFLQRGTLDVDGQRHSAKAAWRLLALLQKEIEVSRKA